MKSFKPNIIVVVAIVVMVILVVVVGEEVFIGGLPRSIEGNVTASKPQTLEEAITITKRMAPKRTSTSAAPAMTHAAIRKLVADSVVVALESTSCYHGKY
nr:reverse transcriptase domain-containing protein [Tanacetum cinerariifolium]